MKKNDRIDVIFYTFLIILLFFFNLIGIMLYTIILIMIITSNILKMEKNEKNEEIIYC